MLTARGGHRRKNLGVSVVTSAGRQAGKRTHRDRDAAAVAKHLALDVADCLDVRVTGMLDDLVARFEPADALWRRKQRAEQKVLDDRELAEDLGRVHLVHTRVDLGPLLDGRDIVEHGRVPAERCRLDLQGPKDRVASAACARNIETARREPATRDGPN